MSECSSCKMRVLKFQGVTFLPNLEPSFNGATLVDTQLLANAVVILHKAKGQVDGGFVEGMVNVLHQVTLHALVP